jgi:hypothetical protein
MGLRSLAGYGPRLTRSAGVGCWAVHVITSLAEPGSPRLGTSTPGPRRPVLPLRSRAPAGYLGCKRRMLSLEPWEGSCAMPIPADLRWAPRRAPLAQVAGRRGAARCGRMLRRRRHPEHPAVDPAAAHAHWNRCHRARLRPRSVVRRGHPDPRRQEPGRGQGQAVGAGRREHGGRDRSRHQHGRRQATADPCRLRGIAVGGGALWVTSVTPGSLGTPGDDAVTRLAVLLALVTDWLGGELVERLGSGSTRAPTWMRLAPCPAPPPPAGHPGPSSPSPRSGMRSPEARRRRCARRMGIAAGIGLHNWRPVRRM